MTVPPKGLGDQNAYSAKIVEKYRKLWASATDIASARSLRRVHLPKLIWINDLGQVSISAHGEQAHRATRGRRRMHRDLIWCALIVIALACPSLSAAAEDAVAERDIREEVWALPLPLPTLAYVVRPVGDGTFPLVVMNHGVSLNAKERSFFPLVEFRDAAKWFARRGNVVVAPVGSGYGAAALDLPEHGIYGPFFSKIGKCTNPNFRDAGLAVALVDLWIIEYMTKEKMTLPNDVIVVGQSAGGWAGIALSSQNPPAVRAIIIFAAGRGRPRRRQAQ